MLNSNPHTSDCFKYSPEKGIFSHLNLPALQNCTQHQLTLDKTNPGAIKDPKSALALQGSLTWKLPTALLSDATEAQKSPL